MQRRRKRLLGPPHSIKAAALPVNDDAVVVWTAAASPPLSYTPQQRCGAAAMPRLSRAAAMLPQSRRFA
jgi:hypothetical protein